MNKAREIWRNKWREARKPLLEALDVEWMRAAEAGDAARQNEIVEKKQHLRDVTKLDLESIDDPYQLGQVWPKILGDKPK